MTKFTREFTITKFPYEVNKDWQAYDVDTQIKAWEQWLTEANELREMLAKEYQQNCSDLHLHYAIGRQTHNDLRNKTVHNSNSMQHPTTKRIGMPGYYEKHKTLSYQ